MESLRNAELALGGMEGCCSMGKRTFVDEGSPAARTVTVVDEGFVISHSSINIS